MDKTEIRKHSNASPKSYGCYSIGNCGTDRAVLDAEAYQHRGIVKTPIIDCDILQMETEIALKRVIIA